MGYRPRHYVDNTALHEAISAYVTEVRDAGTERPVVSEEIGVSLMRIADGVIQRYYRSHHDTDDLRSHAVLVALENLHHFDPVKSHNAFAFCSTVLRNAMLRYITLAETERDYALAYAREHHRGDVRVRKLLADPHTQERLTHHDARRAAISETFRALKSQKPPKPPKPPKERKLSRHSLTLPDGEIISAHHLAKRLGTSHTMIYRRLRAGSSVAEILDEFGPI